MTYTIRPNLIPPNIPWWQKAKMHLQVQVFMVQQWWYRISLKKDTRMFYRDDK